MPPLLLPEPLLPVSEEPMVMTVTAGSPADWVRRCGPPSVLRKRIFKLYKSFFPNKYGCHYSVADPKLFIPDPALNFLSSGSGSRSRPKFRIHADPDPYPQQCNNLSMEYKMSSQTTVKKLNHFKSFIIVKYFCNYRFLRFADHHIHYRYSSKFIKDI